MIPWEDKSQVNIGTNEFVNQFTLNRNFNRLLENDRELNDLIYGGVATELAQYVDAITTYNKFKFIGDGLSLSFPLGGGVPTVPEAYITTINGIIQVPTDAYSIISGYITFVTPPPSGSVIYILNISVNLQIAGV